MKSSSIFEGFLLTFLMIINFVMPEYNKSRRFLVVFFFKGGSLR